MIAAPVRSTALVSATPEVDAELERLGFETSRPRVVALGGGHGLAVTLRAVQRYAGHIAAIVSVADDGGSSGRLTRGLGLPPPGDIRRCLLALTPEPSMFSELFEYRFEEADVGGHALGNLLLAALTDLLGDFQAAVQAAGGLLGSVGEVIPAAPEAIYLTAVVGGQPIEGQVAIAKARGGVESLSLGPPEVAATSRAVQAIAAADQIIIGPGSLFTSLLAVLLVPGMSEAIRRSPAAKVFVLNLIDQDGETLGLSGPRHLEVLAEMAGISGPGHVVVQEGPFAVPDGHRAITLDLDATPESWEIIAADVVDHLAEWPEHEAVNLGRVLEELATKAGP